MLLRGWGRKQAKQAKEPRSPLGARGARALGPAGGRVLCSLGQTAACSEPRERRGNAWQTVLVTRSRAEARPGSEPPPWVWEAGLGSPEAAGQAVCLGEAGGLQGGGEELEVGAPPHPPRDSFQRACVQGTSGERPCLCGQGGVSPVLAQPSPSSSPGAKPQVAQHPDTFFPSFFQSWCSCPAQARSLGSEIFCRIRGLEEHPPHMDEGGRPA